MVSDLVKATISYETPEPKKKLGNERVYLAMYSESQSIEWGQGRIQIGWEPKGRSSYRSHGDMLLTVLFLWLPQSAFLYNPGPPTQGYPAHSEPDLPTSITNLKKMPYRRTYTEPVLMEKNSHMLSLPPR